MSSCRQDNKQAALAHSVRRPHRHVEENFAVPVRITIAEQCKRRRHSTHRRPSWPSELDGVAGGAMLEEKVRGRARGPCGVDLGRPGSGPTWTSIWSTDLAALAPLVAPLISGHSDLAIGTGLGRGSRVIRGAKREFISRCYNLILKSTLAARFSDAQCGFKAIRADVADRLLPHVADTGWFFDTELLVLAERSGLRIHEVPVDWVDDPDSRVDIVATATADPKGIGRLLRGFANGSIPVNTIAAQLGSSRKTAALGSPLRRVVRFGAVGVVSTLAYSAVVHGAADRCRGAGGQPDRPVGDSDREHRRQPAVHVRIAGTGSVTRHPL